MKLNEIKIDQFFYLSEFQCPCCNRVMIHLDLLQRLAKLRRLILEPVYINSGYRCKEENIKVGGADKSYHLFGMAVDISVKQKSIVDLAEFCHSVGFKGIGVYDNYLHLDVREFEEHWEGRT